MHLHLVMLMPLLISIFPILMTILYLYLHLHFHMQHIHKFLEILPCGKSVQCCSRRLKMNVHLSNLVDVLYSFTKCVFVCVCGSRFSNPNNKGGRFWFGVNDINQSIWNMLIPKLKLKLMPSPQNEERKNNNTQQKMNWQHAKRTRYM